MDLTMTDKVALITGAASGLGLKTAEYMAREGVRLVLADRNEEALDAATGRLRATGAEAVTATVDVSSYPDCQRMVEAAVDAFGAVDILVNSAGIGNGGALFEESNPEDWRDLIEINLIGTMNCCRAVVDGMIARRYGKIVCLASEAGKSNEKRIIVYGTTKGGVISFTRGLALELGRHSINVNAVCPGVTMTPMNAFIDEDLEKSWSRAYPLGRLGQAEDIAPLVTFLASDEASWITGQAISISGGFGRS